MHTMFIPAGRSQNSQWSLARPQSESVDAAAPAAAVRSPRLPEGCQALFFLEVEHCISIVTVFGEPQKYCVAYFNALLLRSTTQSAAFSS